MKTIPTPHSPNSRTTIEGDGKPGVSTRVARLRAKQSGQALVFIALSIVVIVAMVGLAIDGGAMYNDRRTAQNGTDASAMAGTRLMLVYYEWMVNGTTSDQDNFPDSATAAQREDLVRSAIDSYAANNGLDTSTVAAYFVDDNKQVVTVNNGPAHNCGIGVGRTPCQVGANGVIPWQERAKGIMVTGTAKSGTFFIGVLGWNQVSASANSTAFMGVAVNSGFDTNLLPIGFFTNTDSVNSLQPQHNYTLIAADNNISSGNWGWINYGGTSPNAATLKAWLTCGFNPSITTLTWPDWCPAYGQAHGEGPIYYWTGWPDDGIPITGSYAGLTVRFGAGNDGWWLAGTTGDKNSACQTFGSISNGTEYIVPIFDVSTAGGSGTLYHLYRLAKFKIDNVDVRCNGQGQHFNIQGIFENTFSPGSSGWHGDIRHNSLHLIFMSP
jgi:Flp pilus assembly protein TadG